MLMNEAYRRILFILFKAEDYVTASALANQLGISIKTLRKYIKIMNSYILQEGTEIQSKVSAGYKIVSIDDSKFYQLKNNIIGSANKLTFYANSQRMRIHFIIRYLLSFNKQVQIQELAEHSFYSESAILKDMKAVKAWLRFYGLKLVSGGGENGIRIQGDEWKIRNLLNWELRIFQNNNLILASEEAAFENLFMRDSKLIHIIRRELLNVLKENHLTISYSDIQSIESWIVMSKTRLFFQNFLTFSYQIKEAARKSEAYVAASGIYARIFTEDPFYSENEIIGLTILLERYNNNLNWYSSFTPMIEIDKLDLFSYFNTIFPGLFDYAENRDDLDELAQDIQLTVNQQILSQFMDIYDENMDFLNQVKLNGLLILDLCLYLMKYIENRFCIVLKSSSFFYMLFLNYMNKNHEIMCFNFKAMCVLSMSEICSKALIDSIDLKEDGILLDKTWVAYDKLNDLNQSEFDYAFTDINNEEIFKAIKIPIVHLSFENFYFDPVFEIEGKSFKQALIQSVFKKEGFIKIETLESISHLNKIIRSITESWNLPEVYFQDIVNYEKSDCEVKHNQLLILKSYQTYNIDESHWGMIFLKKPLLFKGTPCKLICICHFGQQNFLPHIFFFHKVIANIIHNTDFYSFQYSSLSYKEIVEKMAK